MFNPEQEVLAVLGIPGLLPSPGHEAGLRCPLWRITSHTHHRPTPLQARDSPLRDTQVRTSPPDTIELLSPFYTLTFGRRFSNSVFGEL